MDGMMDSYWLTRQKMDGMMDRYWLTRKKNGLNDQQLLTNETEKWMAWSTVID